MSGNQAEPLRRLFGRQLFRQLRLSTGARGVNEWEMGDDGGEITRRIRGSPGEIGERGGVIGRSSPERSVLSIQKLLESKC